MLYNTIENPIPAKIDNAKLVLYSIKNKVATFICKNNTVANPKKEKQESDSVGSIAYTENGWEKGECLRILS